MLLQSSGLSTWGDDKEFILSWRSIWRLVSTAIFRLLYVGQPPYSGKWPRDSEMGEFADKTSRGRCLTPCECSGGEYLGGVARHSLVLSSKPREDIYENCSGPVDNLQGRLKQ